MKNLLLLAFLFVVATGFSQNITYTMLHSGDTITDSGTDHLDTAMTQYYKSISIQVVVTKINGTVAGTGLLQGSIDGINFVNIGTDTLKNTDVTTNTKVWIIDDSPYLHYRVAFAGTGTMSATIKGYLLPHQSGGNKGAVTSLKSGYGVAKDTVTNAGTKTETLKINNWYKTVTLQPVVTKVSGTAAGTVTLQGSNDGVNYVTVNTSYLLGASATMTVTNVTTSTKLFVVTGNPYQYYRFSYAGSGTMVCTIKSYAFTQR